MSHGMNPAPYGGHDNNVYTAALPRKRPMDASTFAAAASMEQHRPSAVRVVVAQPTATTDLGLTALDPQAQLYYSTIGTATAAAATNSAIEIHKVPGLSLPTSSSDAAAAAAAAGDSAAKKSDKGYKGLRQFSMLVCKKVEEKGTTTYNEVADELVLQVMQEKTKVFDEKNIRRRVYDALNVLMAMDIITKDKKAITWKGLPSSAAQDLDMLGREREFRMAEIAKKRQVLQEMLIQQVCYRNLTAQNIARGDVPASQKIPLPFLVVNTHSSAVIQCNMSPDMTDVTFDFSMPFEINDDNTILNRLGMHKTDMNSLREMMPEEMLTYCQQHGLLEPMLNTSATTASASSRKEGKPKMATSDYRDDVAPPTAAAAATATATTH